MRAYWCAVFVYCVCVCVNVREWKYEYKQNICEKETRLRIYAYMRDTQEMLIKRPLCVKCAFVDSRSKQKNSRSTHDGVGPTT